MGCRPNQSDGTAQSQPAAQTLVKSIEWKVQDDSVIRFEYPPDRRALSDTGAKAYMVMASTALDALPDIESISIGLVNPSSSEASLGLRESAAEDIRMWLKDNARIVVSPTPLTLRGGRCLRFQLERIIPPYNNEGPHRYGTELSAKCDASAGGRYTVNSGTENYPDEGKPSPRAREQIQVFERLVKSIEFKK